MITKSVTIKYLISKVKNGKVCDLRISDFRPKNENGEYEVMVIRNEEMIWLPDVKEHLRIVNRRRNNHYK